LLPDELFCEVDGEGVVLAGDGLLPAGASGLADGFALKPLLVPSSSISTRRASPPA